MLGELTTDTLVVVLNKADLLPPDGRDAALSKLQKRLTATFAATRFAGCTQVVVAARPGGGDSMAPGGASTRVCHGSESLSRGRALTAVHIMCTLCRPACAGHGHAGGRHPGARVAAGG